MSDRIFRFKHTGRNMVCDLLTTEIVEIDGEFGTHLTHIGGGGGRYISLRMITGPYQGEVQQFDVQYETELNTYTIEPA